VAGSSLFMLIDDIATLLDDVSLMTKVAAQKTAGVLGDDLALNAQQVSGVAADRELPVVWAVAKGSFVNKLILVPTALGLSAFLPVLVKPLLMLGGLYLCFEGVEKLAHKWLHPKAEDDAHHDALVEALADPTLDVVAYERDKIKGAIRTDFVLSAEIIVISLGTVAAATLTEQLAVLAGIAVIMTVGVYGLVAGIVKIDDAGLYLSRFGGARAAFGRLLLLAAPKLMRALSVLGTAAMFLVGGGILVHGVPGGEEAVHHLFAGLGSLGGALAGMATSGVVGVLAGAVVLAVVTVGGKLFRRGDRSTAH
jgi:predicted DNA repair protein MutK